MEEILKVANELGLMIKGTEIHGRYEELTKKIDADKEARILFEEYAKFSREYYEKESKGDVIEVEDKQKLQELAEKVQQNQLLKEFIATNTYYINMMMQIQSAISEPKGDPIAESKIIKPDQAGKIIKDL